jgi:DNA helicase-4
MAHVKSNALTRELIEARLTSNPSMNTPRTRHFLALYWPIHEAWQAALAAEGAVDFEDMLVRAADFLDTGAVPRTHDLVLVDEFQDISQARARLVRGLVNEPGRYLLTVGDDWQAINRFAGADISVMTHFGGWFGDGPTLHLSKTFRCTQEICDVSSTFVMKNPRQLQKNVTAASGERGPRVVLQYAANADDQALVRAVYTVLERIARTSDISDPGTSGRSPSVYVLGRYNFDSSLMPPRIPQGLSVTFKTIHSSKGLEADYVIVANMSRGRHGFPSEIVDDPVLDLAMSAPDDYAHSEERRLFYVALTRARKQVFLVAAPGRESLFITELAKEEQIEVVNSDQQAIDVGLQPCPVCSDGLLVQRNGKYGPFLGCNRFPRCDHTERDPRRDAGARDLV